MMCLHAAHGAAGYAPLDHNLVFSLSGSHDDRLKEKCALCVQTMHGNARTETKKRFKEAVRVGDLRGVGDMWS